MSRHLAHFPQCSAVVESLTNPPNKVLRAEHGSWNVRRSSRVAISTSVSAPHSSKNGAAPEASNKSPIVMADTTSDNDDFPMNDEDNRCVLLDEEVASGRDVSDFSIGVEVDDDEEKESDDTPESSMLAAYEHHLNSLDDNGLNLSLFSCREKVELDLLQTLSKIGAPMKAYDTVMQWTVRSVRSGHVFRDTAITSRRTILSRATKRLNRDGLKPIWDTLHLPYTDVTIKVAYFNAAAVFADLLSCEHLNKDNNYIFDGDWNPDHNPYAVPSGNIIGDLNTGRSYLKTHQALCRSSNDMLLACPLAIDKTMCDIGGCGRLPLEPITLQYGLVQFDVRKKPEAMRVLGYIHPLNMDIQASQVGLPSKPSANAPLPMYSQCSNATWKMNEYHMQIDFILRKSGFLTLQESGVKWNIKYRGVSYPTTLHPYVPFIIGDTEGHDTLCGHYKSRTAGVAQLCRICECPTMKCGWSKARHYGKRKPGAINRLIQSKRFDILKQKSQHMLVNAFDKVRFGAHSDRGIFGACPGEILHLVLLGWFKYVVQSFFKQIGQNSVPGRKYVVLCRDIAAQLARQSDRSIPRITCNDFSSASNIPGHEYSGILLIMLLALETSRYGEIFDRARALSVQGGHADKHPGHDCFIADWKLLLTSLLEWWAWMKQPHIDRRIARRSVYATSFLLRLLKKVSPRHDGMKNNTIKTHLVLHMSEDIENFGVPEIFNSAYAESAHIPIAKKTVRNTQKRNKTYTIQAAHRYVENLAVSHANRQVSAEASRRNPLERGRGGSGRQWIGKSYTISRNAMGHPECRWRSDERKKINEASPVLQIDDHVLQTMAVHLLPTLEPATIHCQTEYTCPLGVLYRAHPKYEDKPWYDHVLIDWDDVPTPARIVSIINLHNLKADATIKFPGQEAFFGETGLYLIIQSYSIIDTDADKAAKMATRELSMHVSATNRRKMKAIQEEHHTDDDVDPPIFQACRLSLLDSNPHLPCLFIVHVDSIVGPTVMIRDISRRHGPDEEPPISGTHIFMSRSRARWADNWTSFINWQYEKTVHDDDPESSEEED